MKCFGRRSVIHHGSFNSTNSLLCRPNRVLNKCNLSTPATAAHVPYQHERHFVVGAEYADLWKEHAALVIPHIAQKTSTNITVLGRPSESPRSKTPISDENVLLLRSDSEHNIDCCLSQIENFLTECILEIRPSSLQPLLIPIMKYIRNKILRNPNDVEMFVDSYSSQIYIRGDAEQKQLAMECVERLLSPNHLRVFRYLFLCRNIVSKEMVQELSNKYHIFWADNFANPNGSETIEYYLTSIHQSQMHFFFNEIAKIAQSKQPDHVARILYLLRQSFVHHNISASMQIDFMTLIAILKNIPLSTVKDLDTSSLCDTPNLLDLFHRANFVVPPTANNDSVKVSFTQFALTLCLHDRDKRYLDIERILKAHYPEQHISAWNSMYDDTKQQRTRSLLASTATTSSTNGNTAVILPKNNNAMTLSALKMNNSTDSMLWTRSMTKDKEKKMVTVSLRIGNDPDTMPLFIGKKGKNLKFIENAAGLHHVHTSWLMNKEEEGGGYRMGHKDDSITMKGTQPQIEEALRLCTAVLERIGKWYDKRKLKVLVDSLMKEGVASDLDTFDQETFERALQHIPGLNQKKLMQPVTTSNESRIMSFIRGKMGVNNDSKLSDVRELVSLSQSEKENEVPLRLVDMVYNYCASKTGRVWLINLGANFYCNISPMIEFRECFPFVEVNDPLPRALNNNNDDDAIIGINDDGDGDDHGGNKEINGKLNAFYDSMSDRDRSALQRMEGQLVDEWYDMDSDSKRGKERVSIPSSTAMTFKESTMKPLFRHYASCGIAMVQSNEVELVGNAYERMMAKCLLMEPLFLHWNIHHNVGHLLGKKGKRIQNIERFSSTKIEVVHLDDVNVQLMIRGLPSQQQNAKTLCEETQDVLTTTIPRWSVSGVVGRHGKGLEKLQYISGADIFIDKTSKTEGGDDVKVEILGTKHQKSKALKLLQNWGTGTLRFRFEKFKLRITEIPFEKEREDAEVWVKQVLAPYCTVMGMDVIDYRDSKKKRSLAYFAFVWVDSFHGKMKAIRHLNNAHDINLKIWNGEPIGTVLAPAIPYSVSEDEFKRTIYEQYQNVTKIEIDWNSKIERYSAYIEFDDRHSFRRACDHNLWVKGEKLVTFAARQWQKELKSYRFDENEYKKEFSCYLQYCLDSYFDETLPFNKERKSHLTMKELPAVYEEICNVPWIKQPKYSSNSFEHRIWKMHVAEELDERIMLTEEEKMAAENKYFFLKKEDDDDEQREEDNVANADDIHASRLMSREH